MCESERALWLRRGGDSEALARFSNRNTTKVLERRILLVLYVILYKAELSEDESKVMSTVRLVLVSKEASKID